MHLAYTHDTPPAATGGSNNKQLLQIKDQDLVDLDVDILLSAAATGPSVSGPPPSAGSLNQVTESCSSSSPTRPGSGSSNGGGISGLEVSTNLRYRRQNYSSLAFEIVAFVENEIC